MVVSSAQLSSVAATVAAVAGGQCLSVACSTATEERRREEKGLCDWRRRLEGSLLLATTAQVRERKVR